MPKKILSKKKPAPKAVAKAKKTIVKKSQKVSTKAKPAPKKISKTKIVKRVVKKVVKPKVVKKVEVKKAPVRAPVPAVKAKPPTKLPAKAAPKPAPKPEPKAAPKAAATTMADIAKITAKAISELKPEKNGTPDETRRRTKIIALKGGNYGPEESLKNFQGAINDGCDGIEFDLWLSKDNELMVLHGGLDGDLGKYGFPNDRVQDWDSTQLQTKIDIGGGQRIPTLEQVIMLALDSPKMQLHIDLKGPQSEEANANYDSMTACKRLRDAIDFYQIVERTTVISFRQDILAKMDKCRKVRWMYVDFRCLSILPNSLDFAHVDLSTRPGMQGVVVHNAFLRQEHIEKTHEGHKLVGLFCDSFKGKNEAEEAKLYDKAFGKAGKTVDLFYSDFPSKAMKARNKIQSDD